MQKKIQNFLVFDIYNLKIIIESDVKNHYNSMQLRNYF